MVPDLINWLTILFLLGLGYLALTAQWRVAVALMPRFVERCRDMYAQPIRATIFGLIVWLPFLVLVVALKPVPPVLALILVIPILLSVSGSAGLALRIGSGMAQADDAGRTWIQVTHGGCALALTLVLPFIGWFVLLPWLALSGAGVAAMGLVTRKP